MILIILGVLVSAIVTLLSYFFWFQSALLILVFICAYIIYILIFLLSAYLITFICRTVKVDKNGNVTKKKPCKIFKVYTYLATDFLKYIFRVKVNLIGKEKLPKENNFLLVCNHQSLMDPVLIISSFKRADIYYIMKKQIRKIPIVGRWLQEAGYYYLDRENNREGLKLILECISDLKNGKNVGLFIEGTRSKGPNLGEFHDASLRMALKSKVDIVVMCVDNCYMIKNNYPFKKTKVTIKVCDVLTYDDYNYLSTSEISDKLKTIIQNNLDDIRK